MTILEKESYREKYLLAVSFSDATAEEEHRHGMTSNYEEEPWMWTLRTEDELWYQKPTADGRGWPWCKSCSIEWGSCTHPMSNVQGVCSSTVRILPSNVQGVRLPTNANI